VIAFIHHSTRTILAVLLFVCSLSAMTPSEARAWQKDLRFMAEQMREKHKNLNHSLSVQDFNTKVEALNASIATALLLARTTFASAGAATLQRTPADTLSPHCRNDDTSYVRNFSGARSASARSLRNLAARAPSATR